MSHADLPEEERKLRIENYMSSLPEGTMGRLWRTVSGREKDKSVDQYLAQMSNDKDALIGQFKGLLPQHATPGTKVANRSSEEWRRLTAAGHHEDAANLARRYAEMGKQSSLPTGYLVGGVEAGVDQMMGRVSNPQTGAINESGVFARKLYKPDSRSSRGDYTPGLLEQKQQFTNEARAPISGSQADGPPTCTGTRPVDSVECNAPRATTSTSQGFGRCQPARQQSPIG
jgi:hypothetical protein